MLSIQSLLLTVSPDKGHLVDMESDTLLFKTEEKFNVNWNPKDLMTSTPFGINSSSLLVSIYVYYQTYDYLGESRWGVKWVPVEQAAATKIRNTQGQAEIALTKEKVECNIPIINGGLMDACPLVVKVSVDGLVNGDQRLSSELNIGIWSGVAFLYSCGESKDCTLSLRGFCETWSGLEERRREGGEALLSRVLSCPPTLSLAISDPNFELENFRSSLGTTRYPSQRTTFLHPASSSCFGQVT